MMDALIKFASKKSRREKTYSRQVSRYLMAGMALFVVVCMTSSGYAESNTNPALDEEINNYWSVERDLPAVQQKLHEKTGRMALGLFGGLMTSEPFFYYIPVGGRLTYNFSDHLGLELAGAFMDVPGTLTNNTELTDFLESRRGDSFRAERHTEDRFLWRSNVSMVWSPFYGKLAFLQRKMSHFDLNLALGAGIVNVERPSVDRTSSSTEIAFEGIVGLGAHFYLSKNFVLRLDGRGYVYAGAETPTNKDSLGARMNFPIEFLFGLSYLF